jgi:hypothetical protein
MIVILVVAVLAFGTTRGAFVILVAAVAVFGTARSGAFVILVVAVSVLWTARCGAFVGLVVFVAVFAAVGGFVVVLVVAEVAGGFGQWGAAQQGDAQVMADRVDRADVTVGLHCLGDRVDLVVDRFGVLFTDLT